MSETGIFETGAIDLKALVRAHAATIERKAILLALSHAGWVRKEAARLLGISIPALSYKMFAHGLRRSNDSASDSQEEAIPG